MSTFVTVDIIIETPDGIPLIRRGSPPYRGCWAIPGGFVEDDERVEQAAIREAREETGLEVKNLSLLGVYSDPDRDPRGRSISIAFVGMGEGDPCHGSDAAEVKLFKLKDIPKDLAFDHSKMIEDYKNRLNEESEGEEDK